ncbi:HTH-like domain-containing protein [Ensifer sp. YR511]|nr:HTH-like domain-containing protein [Ensifer sp. YR511]
MPMKLQRIIFLAEDEATTRRALTSSRAYVRRSVLVYQYDLADVLRPVSIPRACGALDLDRSTYHYTSRRADQAGLERRIQEICETRVRYGYRRVHVLLEREGWSTHIKRTYRIYRDLGLQLRNKTPKRRVKAKLREDRQMAIGPNDVWAMDFVHDQLATGKKQRVLATNALRLRCGGRHLLALRTSA